MADKRTMIKADHVCDATGKYCADLTPALKSAPRGLASGQTIEVRTDDATARADVPAWARLTGNELLQVIEENDTDTTFIIKVK